MTDRGVAIVTGGPSAIGVAIAEALLADGWKLILADLAQGPLDTARTKLDVQRTHDGGPIVNIASGPVDTAMHDDAIRAAGRICAGPDGPEVICEQQRHSQACTKGQDLALSLWNNCI
jgi:NAD(P)-dependent dehydrogenase (short-subunit alcohol dehydrogenase family)